MARSLMVVLAAVAVVLTWRLARRLSADGAIWAAVVLMFLPQFAETSTETRPDVPALVAHLASLLALVRWREGRGSAWLWAVGAWQGTALALSLKGVFGLAGVLLVVVGASRRARAGPDGWRGRLGSIARFAGGLGLVVGALLGVFVAIGRRTGAPRPLSRRGAGLAADSSTSRRPCPASEASWARS